MTSPSAFQVAEKKSRLVPALRQDLASLIPQQASKIFSSRSEVNDDPKPKRRRNILWFNTPFSKNVRTNFGRTFLSLVRKHFPAHHKLYKIFNKNNMKVSYSCMSNIDSFIKGHNSAIMRWPMKKLMNRKSCVIVGIKVNVLSKESVWRQAWCIEWLYVVRKRRKVMLV